jgi:hypothetical protein
MSTKTATGPLDDGMRNIIKIAAAVGSVVAGFKALVWLIDTLTD